MIGSNREGHSRREEQHDKGMEVGKQKKKKCIGGTLKGPEGLIYMGERKLESGLKPDERPDHRMWLFSSRQW